MTTLGTLVHPLDRLGLLALSDHLVSLSTHHHALFLDRTVSDALGGEGWSVRNQASFDAAFAMLRSLCAELGIGGAKEKLDLSSELFSAMGHGKISFSVTAEGGEVVGRHLHHGKNFVEKYGSKVQNRKAVDAFAAGYCAAALSLAYPSDWGMFEAEETECIARQDASCQFVLSRRPERTRLGPAITRADAEQHGSTGSDDAPSDEAVRVSAAVSAMLKRREATEHGAIDAFGCRLSVVPLVYVHQITYDTMHLVEKRTPELFQVYAALVREAAQMSTFHLLGGLCQSEEWRSELGPPESDPAARLEQLLGAARALGMGRLAATEYVPGSRLVLRAPVTHETIYYSVRHGNTVRSRLQQLQGVALGIMQLLGRAPGDSITEAAYDQLFASGPRLYVEETLSPLRGDSSCEVAVEVMADR